MFRPLLIALTVLATPAWLVAAGNTTTLEGTLVSASCYVGSHDKGNAMGSDKQCGTHCLMQGRPGGLVTQDNNFYFLDAPSLRLAPYVGQQIRVTGDQDSKDVISVTKVEVKQGEAWQPINISRKSQK